MGILPLLLIFSLHLAYNLRLWLFMVRKKLLLQLQERTNIVRVWTLVGIRQHCWLTLLNWNIWAQSSWFHSKQEAFWNRAKEFGFKFMFPLCLLTPRVGQRKYSEWHWRKKKYFWWCKLLRKFDLKMFLLHWRKIIAFKLIGPILK